MEEKAENKKKTFAKYVEIARTIRNTGTIQLDISLYSEDELYIIVGLAKSDSLFDYLDACKDIDIETMELFLEWNEKKAAYETASKELLKKCGSKQG